MPPPTSNEPKTTAPTITVRVQIFVSKGPVWECCCFRFCGNFLAKSGFRFLMGASQGVSLGPLLCQISWKFSVQVGFPVSVPPSLKLISGLAGNPD
ncbi:hypothetical protein MTP99_003520 [Tenebrio molitor]|nr:hypothetical protein MTP99_003520 [Tenebrio molitor]